MVWGHRVGPISILYWPAVLSDLRPWPCAILANGLETVRLSAYRLKIIGIIRATFGFRDDVIHFGAGMHHAAPKARLAEVAITFEDALPKLVPLVAVSAQMARGS